MSYLNLKLHSVDNGYCRVYYRHDAEGDKRLFCMQEEGKDNFELLVCTDEGEPDYPMRLDNIESIELPEGDSVVEVGLRSFLLAQAFKHAREVFLAENRSEAGGWSKSFTDSIGVPWPLKRGWKQEYIENGNLPTGITPVEDNTVHFGKVFDLEPCVYKVWIEIEKYNERTGEGENVDAPGAAVAEFDEPHKAREFAVALEMAGNSLLERPYSVLLEYPDRCQAGAATETYFTHVTAASVADAVEAARGEASANNLNIDPEEFGLLIVLEGHIEAEAYAGDMK